SETHTSTSFLLQREPTAGPVLAEDGHSIPRLVIAAIAHNGLVDDELHLEERFIGQRRHHIAQIVVAACMPDTGMHRGAAILHIEGGIAHWAGVAPSRLAPKAPVTGLTEHHGVRILLPRLVLVAMSDGEIHQVGLTRMRTLP